MSPTQSVRLAAGWPHGFSFGPSTPRSIVAGLRREPRLGHHEVPAEVDDRVDVLDVDGALAHARAAGHAVPDDLVGDGAGHERLQLDRAGRDGVGIDGRPRGRGGP